MDDARLARIGKAFTQIGDLLMTEASVEERIWTLCALVGQLSCEYQASENAARDEGWQAGFQAGRAEGATAGRSDGRREALEAAERAITDEPVTMEQAEGMSEAADVEDPAIGNAGRVVH
jgi:hypothetical protein